MAQFLLGYTHRLEAVLHPTCQAILTPIKVTTNKLEKGLLNNYCQSHIALTAILYVPDDHVQISPYGEKPEQQYNPLL
jgi:hypothetical protein